VKYPGTIVDLRPDKNTVMCSLTYQEYVAGLQLLSNTLRDYYNKGQYFDKIYILNTTNNEKYGPASRASWLRSVTMS
jgi:hypothetical protein